MCIEWGEIVLNNHYGYPSSCNKCESCRLVTVPYVMTGKNTKRIMLIGQDPTIANGNKTAKMVLMLNEENGQLYRWLNGIFLGKLKAFNIYATNAVKCVLDEAPLPIKQKYLQRYFDLCKVHLRTEMNTYKPHVVITFGEPAHILFSQLLRKDSSFFAKMTKDFDGKFHPVVSIDGISFDYSPCLHIKTFRVAETYGEKIEIFKSQLKENILA